MAKFDVPKFYLKAMKSFTHTTVDEDIELIKRHRNGDREATARLTNNCLGIIVKFVKKYCVHADPDDLLCAGNDAIVQALRKYDPKFRVKFLSYASQWIKAYIMRETKRAKSIVSMGRNTDILQHLSLNEKIPNLSHSRIEDEGVEFIDMLRSNSEPADVTAERADLARSVNKTMKRLTKDHRLTLMYRFMTHNELTLEMVGKKEKLGRRVNRERVRQIQISAIDQFKMIHSRHCPDYAETT